MTIWVRRAYFSLPSAAIWASLSVVFMATNIQARSKRTYDPTVRVDRLELDVQSDYDTRIRFVLRILSASDVQDA